MNQVGFLFDANRCIGCHSCRVSCQVQRGTGPELNWRQVTAHESGAFPDVVQYNLSISCNHCARPACMAVCPTGAILKSPGDGVVTIFAEQCNGCGRCIAACPYGAPQRAPGMTVVSKCDSCVERRAAGLQPVCVETCVGGALRFGQLDALELAERQPLQSSIDGFFDPAWTQPSIRFVQLKRRTDEPEGSADEAPRGR